jgi:hypothetical protein
VGFIAKVNAAQRIYGEHDIVSVLCVPLVIPLFKARLQLQQAKSGDRRGSGQADQQQRRHLKTSKTLSLLRRSSA